MRSILSDFVFDEKLKMIRHCPGICFLSHLSSSDSHNMGKQKPSLFHDSSPSIFSLRCVTRKVQPSEPTEVILFFFFQRDFYSALRVSVMVQWPHKMTIRSSKHTTKASPLDIAGRAGD